MLSFDNQDSVIFYDDRVEVSSPGGLPKGMRLIDLGKKSAPRNQTRGKKDGRWVANEQ